MKRIPLVGVSILGVMLAAAVCEAAEPSQGAPATTPAEKEKMVIAEKDAAAASPQVASPRDTPVPKTAEAPEYWLGIECQPVPSVLSTQLALPEGSGVYVEHVVPGSPAEAAKIFRHDILVKANGKAIESIPDLIEVVGTSEGKPLQVELIRAGKQIKLEVTPGKRPMVIRDLDEEGSLPQGPTPDDPMGWFGRRFGGFPGGVGGRFRVLHPGVILPGGAKTGFELSEDTSVTIIRKGNQPAEIKVRFEGKDYETTEDKLDVLPEGVRGTVESMLGGPWRAGGGNILTIGPQMGGPQMGAPSQEAVRQEMTRLMEKMDRDIESLRDRMRRLTPGIPPGPPVPPTPSAPGTPASGTQSRPKGSF